MAQTLMVKRPNPATYDVSKEGLKKAHALNDNLRYVQGFRTSLAANTTVTTQISLNSAGKRLLGIAIIPANKIIDSSDVLITLVVNNNNVILNMPVPNADPTAVTGMIFFPIPQKLFGNDIITLTYTNNSLSSMVLNASVYYVPQ